MYTPRPYREDDPAVLHELIRRFNFGTLYTPAGVDSHATHLPFMIDTDRGAHGTLIAHMARANPHWKVLEDGAESLAVFLGAHSYISPGWYENQDAVPTWNYAAVHAHGRARLVTDREPLVGMLEDLVESHESAVGCPWDRAHIDGAMERNLPGVVGFEIEIARLEGKFKFNQKSGDADRRGVVTALEASDDPLAREVAAIMRRKLDDR